MALRLDGALRPQAGWHGALRLDGIKGWGIEAGDGIEAGWGIKRPEGRWH